MVGKNLVDASAIGSGGDLVHETGGPVPVFRRIAERPVTGHRGTITGQASVDHDDLPDLSGRGMGDAGRFSVKSVSVHSFASDGGTVFIFACRTVQSLSSGNIDGSILKRSQSSSLVFLTSGLASFGSLKPRSSSVISNGISQSDAA